MNRTPVRYNTSFGRMSQESLEDSPKRLALQPPPQVVTENPGLIISPKMRNIYMLIENEDAEPRTSSESQPTTEAEMDKELGVQEGSLEEQYRAKVRRQTQRWAEAQAEAEAEAAARARAEAEANVDAQKAQVRAQARATLEAEARSQISFNSESEAELYPEEKPEVEPGVTPEVEPPPEAETLPQQQARQQAQQQARQQARPQARLGPEPETEARTDAEVGDSRTSEEDREAHETAVKIVQGIYDKISYREYANFLGAKENSNALQNFIVLLEPLPNSLVLSLYKLVTRLYFIAEAQAIDRILEELSKGWVSANPETHWGSHYKLCHIVLFALLILNSDLHNTENTNNQTKFSKEEFVDNTLYAVSIEAVKCDFDLLTYEAEISEELCAYYDALKSMSLPLLNREENRRDSRVRDSKDWGIRQRRRNSKASSRSQLGFSVENSSSDDESSVLSTASTSLRRESHYTSNWRFHNNKPLLPLYRQESFDTLFKSNNNSLWCMDSGIQMNERNFASPTNDRSATQRSKHLMPSGGILRWITRSKPKSLLHENKPPVAFFDGNTNWSKVRCKVFEGRMYVFRTHPASVGPQDSTEDLEGLKRISDAFFVCSLYESLAKLVQENVVVNSGNNHRPTTHHRRGSEADPVHRGNFTVTIPAALHRDKTVLEFQTESVMEAQNFANCVNFWAARLTTVPTAQFEIVSNEENGWSPQIIDGNLSPSSLDRMYLSEWKPLLSIGHLYNEQETTTEESGMTDKISELQSFTEYLQQSIDIHNRIKPQMVSVWQRTRNFEKAMDNWNKKYLYLNELNEKSSVYLHVLNLALEDLPQ